MSSRGSSMATWIIASCFDCFKCRGGHLAAVQSCGLVKKGTRFSRAASEETGVFVRRAHPRTSEVLWAVEDRDLFISVCSKDDCDDVVGE